MDYYKIREITTEMCGLLEQQRKLVKDTIRPLAGMAGAMDRYTHTNDRLCQLCKELDELV